MERSRRLLRVFNTVHSRQSREPLGPVRSPLQTNELSHADSHRNDRRGGLSRTGLDTGLGGSSL